MEESFYIGGVFFDPESNSVIINGQEKRIKPKVMMLMCYLAKNYGRVVTKEEILTNLWQDVVVGDEAVTRLIFNLRNVLADDAKKPEFIETISKRGYRLLLAPQIINNKVTGNKSSLIALVVFAPIVIWLLVAFFTTKNELGNTNISEVTSLTSSAGLDRHFNVNPKTDDLIYVHRTTKGSQLFLLSKEHENLIQLTDSHSEKRSPKWLNDNTFIYIQSRRDDFAITRQNLAGKEEDLFTSPNFIYWVNQTKEKLFFTEESTLSVQPQIHLKSVDLVTGYVRNFSQSLSQLPANISSFAVDLKGNNVFLSDHNGQLMWFESDRQEVHHLQSSFSRVHHIEVINEHTLLVTGENDAASGIWQVNIKNNEQRLLLSSTGGQQIVQAKFHQDELIYSTYQFDTDLYLYKEEESLPLEPINTPYNELYPKFIGEQDRILFISNRGGGYDLWSHKLNSNFAEQLTHFKALRMYPPVLSPDGQLVAVSFELESNYLAVVDLSLKSLQSKVESDYQRFPLGWSENNQTLFFSEYSGDINLFETSQDLTETKLIALNGGLFAYLNNQTNSVTFADYAEEGIKTLSDKGNVLNFVPLSLLKNLSIGEAIVKHNSLYAASRKDAEYKVQKINLLDGHAKSVMSLPVQSQFSDIAEQKGAYLYFMRDAAGPQGDIIKVSFED